MRTFIVTRAYNVRRYERWEVQTTEDLGDLHESMTFGKFDEYVMAHGDELSSDFGTVDDDQLDVWIEEEILPEPEEQGLEVPYPPTTPEQAEAWVAWAEAEIGVGWHPDTAGEDLVRFSPVGLEAVCRCGETFCPSDMDDTIHLVRDKDGEECGLRGVVTGSWGSNVPLFTGDRLQRYNDGLAAAHRLLPDIYATSMDVMKRLHPELITPKGE